MIRIIAVDKIKEKSIKNSIDIYLKRLENRLKLDIIEVPSVNYQYFDCIKKAINVEGEKIIDKLSGGYKNKITHTRSQPSGLERNFIITLDENGSQFTSIEFSKMISETLNYKQIIFILGGAFGLSENVLKQSNLVLSISKMTFTHEMARLFLIEQIYRAFMIYSNAKYHN